MRNTPKILITGAPASGKGTQCEKIVEKFGCVHISTGDMLREAVRSETELGMEAKKFMDAGELVPDSLVIGMLEERLRRPDVSERGWLLDGFPRTPAQADALDRAGIIPRSVIHLDVADEVVVERISGRRNDPVTGRIYHLKYDPPENDEIRSRLTQRSDDTEEKILVRLKNFHTYEDAILKKYAAVVQRVDGQQSKGEVFDHVQAIIESSLTKKEVMSIPEFVRRAEVAFENGEFDTGSVNWSGQAGADVKSEKGSSTYSDIALRPVLAAGDLAAILLFAYIGRSAHGDGALDIEVLKTAMPFILGWFALAPPLGGYTSKATESWSSMLGVTVKCWAGGVPLGLALRGLYLSRVPPAVFAGISMGFTLVAIGGWRSLYLFVNGTSDSESGIRRGGLLDGFRMISTLLRRW